jgi:hypothetical protein
LHATPLFPSTSTAVRLDPRMIESISLVRSRGCNASQPIASIFARVHCLRSSVGMHCLRASRKSALISVHLAVPAFFSPIFAQIGLFWRAVPHGGGASAGHTHTERRGGISARRPTPSCSRVPIVRPLPLLRRRTEAEGGKGTTRRRQGNRRTQRKQGKTQGRTQGDTAEEGNCSSSTGASDGSHLPPSLADRSAPLSRPQSE